MRKLIRGMQEYPLVIATITVGVLGGLLVLSGLHAASAWLVSLFAIAVALQQAVGMVRELRSGTYGIDLLAVTAIGSTVAVGEHWAALVVCLMLSGGEALEDLAAGRARRELTALLGDVPQVAHRMTPAGDLVDLPVDEIAVGDAIVVRPFEVVPVDAVLLEGGATFDESRLTGESLPVDRAAGDAVLSGALNGAAPVTLRATATAANSQYQRIVELVREAQDSKAPFVRLADRVAVPFTVFALLLAVGAWIVTGDPGRMAEVLVVATPCPLIIAAPVAFMGGMSRAARAGIIIKDSGTLEQLATVRTAAFDKTGTLTHGEPRVVAVRPTSGGEDDLLALAAAVERHSGHPLARAIVEEAVERGLGLPEAHGVTELPGHGVRAVVDGRPVLVGKAGTDVDSPADGNTEVHVTLDGRPAGVITLADEVRAEARATIELLRAVGVTDTIMVTGDHALVAAHVAGQVGIADVRADLLPQDKVAVIDSAPSRPVMMVGDGVNDAPVLAAADVGVAMGARGSTAASESADVVIMLDDLARVARAVLIGRRTMRVSWQAIGIGVGMSVALMVVAALGFLPAIVGAWLQELVDLACILWALMAMRPGREERQLGDGPAHRGPVPRGAGALARR